MKEIPLTRGHIALIDDGDFDMVIKFKWMAAECTSTHVYAIRHIKKKGIQTRVYLHRWLLDAKKGELVDHKNRNTLDCRRDNLRLVTPSQNTRNRSPFGKSKFMGVCLHPKGRKRWLARIVIEGQIIRLGGFLTVFLNSQA